MNKKKTHQASGLLVLIFSQCLGPITCRKGFAEAIAEQLWGF